MFHQILVSSNYDVVIILVKKGQPGTSQRFHRAHARKIVKTLYHIVVLWWTLENSHKVTQIDVEIWTCTAENNELKFHKWKEICRPPLYFNKTNFNFYLDISTSSICRELRNPEFKTLRKSTIIW